MFAYVAVAGSLGALPTLPELGSSLWDTVSSVNDTPEERLLGLVEKRKIRPARQSDIDQWFDKAGLSKEEQANASLYVHDSFVVLEAIRLPGNMYGAHSKAFIIPDGVPLPKGEPAHNSFYLMKNGTCIGAGSNCAIL